MQSYRKFLLLEWRLFTAEPGTWIVLVLMMFSAIGAIVNGVSNVQMQSRFVNDARDDQKQRYTAAAQAIDAEKRKTDETTIPVTSWTPVFAPAAREAVYNFKAVLPPPSLAALGFGQTDLHSQSFRLVNNSDDRPIVPTTGTHVLSNIIPQYKTESTLRLWLGKWDFVFVVTYLYPLFILALSHDLIASDRATGTLALVLAQGISVRSLALTRFLVRMVAVVVAGIAIPTIALTVAHSLVGLPADPGRVVLWILAATGYVFFWLAAALVVNALNWSATRNAVVLVSLWTVVSLLIPVGAGFLVRVVAPMMPNASFTDAERFARNEANEKTTTAYEAMVEAFNRNFPLDINVSSKEKQQRELGRFTDSFQRPAGNEILDTFYSAHPEYPARLTHFQLWYAAQLGRDLFTEKRLSNVLGMWREQQAQHHRLARWLMFFSPSMLVHASLTDIAGTGSHRYRGFLSQLDDYIRKRESWFTGKILKLEPISSSELLTQELFEVKPERTLEAAARVAFPIMSLWIFAVLLLIAGWIRFSAL